MKGCAVCHTNTLHRRTFEEALPEPVYDARPAFSIYICTHCQDLYSRGNSRGRCGLCGEKVQLHSHDTYVGCRIYGLLVLFAPTPSLLSQPFPSNDTRLQCDACAKPAVHKYVNLDNQSTYKYCDSCERIFARQK